MERPRSTLFQRAGTSGGRSVSAAQGSSADVTAAMERENDEVLRALRDDVRSLKGISAAIGTEVTLHNTLLDAMHTSMDSVRNGLKVTMRKLDTVTGTSGMAHIWLLLIFAFGVCFFIFLLLKFR